MLSVRYGHDSYYVSKMNGMGHNKLLQYEAHAMWLKLNYKVGYCQGEFFTILC